MSTLAAHPISLTLTDLEVYYDQPDAGEAAPAAGEAAPAAAAEQRFHLRIPRLSLRGGEMIGVAGRSGEGKSTLLHVLALLLRPPRLKEIVYEYSVGGEPRKFVYAQPQTDVTDSQLEQVRNEAFGLIFQQHFLLPYFNVRDNVALPVMVRPGYQFEDYRQPIDDLLEMLGLDDLHRAKRPAQLSGGQNQRVAVARALVHAAPFLFADEPTANLDKHKRERVLRQLRAAADDGRCVILVSHELGDLANYCDHILMVQENKLNYPFGDSANPPAEASVRPLPPLERKQGRSQPRSPTDVAWITGELSNLIWPTEGSKADEEGAQAKREARALAKPAATPQPAGRLGFRLHAYKYAAKEIFSRKGAVMRVLMLLLLSAASCTFFYLSDLGQGAVRYLTETTLNKPSEYLNRFTARRKDPTNRLTPAQVAFLAERPPGMKAPPTFRQRLFQYEVYKADGQRDRKNYAFSVPDGDDSLAPVAKEDRDTAQIGVVYLKGGPFPAGQTDRAGVIVSRRFLRQAYWGLNQADAPDGKLPDTLEFRMAVGTAGVEEEEQTYLPGINGRVVIPVVGVFDYPTLVIKNTTGGEEGLPQVYFPENFLRRMDMVNDRPVWEWYHAFLVKRCGEGNQPLTAPYDVLRSVKIQIDGGKRQGDWLKEDLATGVSQLSRDLKRPFGNSLVPFAENGAVVLRFDKAREEPSQKLTKEKFEKVLWPDIQKALVEASQGGKVTVTYETQPVSALFTVVELAPLPANQPVYNEAVVRLKGFRDVLPARRVVEQKYGEELEIEPKGGQVAALERFEAISGIMEFGHLGLQLTFLVCLTFILGITSYMHVMAKTSDIGILRSYGLSPRSIAWVYFLELALLMVPACILGIAVATGVAGLTNDWIAETVVLTTKPGDEADAGPVKKAEPLPKVFLTMQQDWTASLTEWGKTVGLVVGILVLVSFLSVWMIKRQQIVDSLRAGAG